MSNCLNFKHVSTFTDSMSTICILEVSYKYHSNVHRNDKHQYPLEVKEETFIHCEWVELGSTFFLFLTFMQKLERWAI